MKIAIGGASGMLGSRLDAALVERGDEVVRLVRKPATSESERQWDPQANTISVPGLSDVDAVVNLAGAPIAGSRWAAEYKREILSSRVLSTRTVVQALADAREEGSDRCKTFLSASAVGIYGFDCGDRLLPEDAPVGTGFLADVCEKWEDEALPASDLGVRVVRLRTANVLSPRGGFLGALRPLFKFGVAGRIGDGRQWLSWIHIDDHVAAMVALLDGTVSGPVNLTAPNPVRNASFTREYGRVLNRPTFIPFPSPVARIALTPNMVDETVAAGQRAVPEALARGGFKFSYPVLGQALRNLEGQRRETPRRSEKSRRGKQPRV